MGLSDTGLVLVTILTIVFVCVILFIVWYMIRKHRSKSVALTPWQRLIMGGSLVGNDDDLRPPSERSGSLRSSRSADVPSTDVGTRDLETHTGFLIPDGLRLLKTCKALTHRLMATVIHYTSAESSKGLVVGKLDDIVACAKTVSPSVDALTKSMYPPIDDQVILTTATEMVNAVEELVTVAKQNCVEDKLHWLDPCMKDVLHDYKTLVASVQKFRNLHENPDDYFTDA